MKRKIYYFTDSFPYGIGENWKLHEVQILSQYFSEIEIIPNNYAGNKIPRQLNIDNVRINEPLFENNSQKVKFQDLVQLFLSSDALFFLNEFFRKALFLKKSKMISFLNDSIKCVALKNHKVIKRIINKHQPNDVLYFFWGKGTCLIVPLLKKQITAEIYIRLHRYDLYEYVNNNYIPFRLRLLKSASRLILISEDGKNYLIKKYPAIREKIVVNRLGALSKGLSKPSEDGVLRIFSCSSLTHEKRVSFLAKSLQFLKFKIEWTHIGNGPLLNELMEIANNFDDNISFNFTGWVNPNNVLNFYVEKPCDLFINVSTTEGIPVSIMEAFSAGIPAFATDVGGIKEIVNNENGKLLQKDIQPQQLAVLIENFYYTSKEIKENFRKSAYKTYEQFYNAHVNAGELASLFIDNVKTST